jgi:deazaflavin-dependent oxidoreductase (nitroreductase family)
MPYPRWVAKMNRRLLNPREIRRGKYPVLIHVGRKSGTVYETPMDAHPTRTGWVMVVRYGPESDWVRNTFETGTATLRVAGKELTLRSPRLVSQDEAVAEFEPGFDPGKDFYKAEHFLLMDLAE